MLRAEDLVGGCSWNRDLHVMFSPVSVRYWGFPAGFADGVARDPGALRVHRPTSASRERNNGSLAPNGSRWLSVYRRHVTALSHSAAPAVLRGGALLLVPRLPCCSAGFKRAWGRVDNAWQLGIRYPSHRPGRAVLCIALIASATFLIVAVDSFPPHDSKRAWISLLRRIRSPDLLRSKYQ